jgi:enoyl-CoA hydratase/carnithine racemase
MSQIANGELVVERKGAVLWVLFNRPQARNALTSDMYEGVVALCNEVNEDRSIRSMVLAGMCQTFAAGTDISHFREFTKLQDALDYEARGNLVMATLESVRVPVVAAISGPCTGGGAAIASCCDIRLASPSARFGIPIARTLGNCLSHQSYARLVALLGLARTTEILLTGRLMDAQELLAAGVVTEVLAEDELFPRAQALAETLAANAPLTLEVSKRGLHRVRDRLFPVEDDRDLIKTCYMSADFREGVEAFMTKRRPVWQGR